MLALHGALWSAFLWAVARKGRCQSNQRKWGEGVGQDLAVPNSWYSGQWGISPTRQLPATWTFQYQKYLVIGTSHYRNL